MFFVSCILHLFFVEWWGIPSHDGGPNTNVCRLHLIIFRFYEELVLWLVYSQCETPLLKITCPQLPVWQHAITSVCLQLQLQWRQHCYAVELYLLGCTLFLFQIMNKQNEFSIKLGMNLILSKTCMKTWEITELSCFHPGVIMQHIIWSGKRVLLIRTAMWQRKEEVQMSRTWVYQETPYVASLLTQKYSSHLMKEKLSSLIPK